MRKGELTKAKDKAWKAFRLYRVTRPEFMVGNLSKCVTCGALRPVGERGGIQGGHFIPGHHNAVIFEEHNVHPQCDYCNRILGSNGPMYYQFMLKRYGQSEIDRLLSLENGPAVKYTVQDYLDIETKYLKLLK